jgi:sporulation protein YlmC with PRC-barrel domain
MHSQRGVEKRNAPISRMIDARLYSRTGNPLGTIDELIIDLDSGRVRYLLVAGVGGRRYRFPWEAVLVQRNGFVLRHIGPGPVLAEPPGPDRRRS